MSKKFPQPSERFWNTQSHDKGQKLPELPDYNINEPCDEHTDKFYEVFCLDHSEMCCIICLVENHRHCVNIKTVEKVVEMFVEDKIDEAVIKDLNCLNRVMTKLIKKKEKQIEKISAEKERIISESDRCIKEAIDKLEKMKSEIKTDVSRTFLSQIKPIQEQIDIFSGLNESIVQNESFLINVKDQGNAKKVFLTLQKIKITLRTQRKKFEETATDETDNNTFELVQDQSLLNFIKNTQIPFEILNRKQSKGWKDLSKTEIMKKLDILAERFDTKGSFQNRSENIETIRTEYNSKAGTHPSCIDYESTAAIEAAGFMMESSIEDEDSKSDTFEDDITIITEHSVKTNSKPDKKPERKSGKERKETV
ncbi:unnamed protein product [Mytilus edulis]|uniref:B box-type domain-containing protein n=1 Tax=Mytilus edulis TaxID=6550 RepID=A0A8S3UJS0_MYTED|nr:unnamed protein product [Mytilus edulis]